MVDAFLDKFVVITERVTIADLAALKPNKDEPISNFICRWRSLYVKCDIEIEEEDAVAMILKSIDNWMIPFLSVANIPTLQQLMQYVNRLQARPPPGAVMGFNNNNRFQRGGRADTNIAEVATTDDKANGSKPTYGANNKYNMTLAERRNKPYSFRRDKVAKIFRDALKDNLPLPECKRPEDAHKSDQPNFCPYHRMLGHTIENCYVFKDLIERKYKSGDITLPQSVLQNPAPHAQVNMISHTEQAMVTSTRKFTQKHYPVLGGTLKTSKEIDTTQLVADTMSQSLLKEPAFCCMISSKERNYGESSRSRGEARSRFNSLNDRRARDYTDTIDDVVRNETLDSIKIESLKRQLLLREMEIEELKQMNGRTEHMLKAFQSLNTHHKEGNERRANDDTDKISFTDKDLLLGTASHNRPLYTTGSIGRHKLDCIMIDPGSSINVVPAWLPRSLGVENYVTTYEKDEIHGFNKNHQKIIGTIKLELQIEELVAETKFSVVETETPFVALLGRPWLHDNKVVPSTLHQCMKYIKDGKEMRIDGDLKQHDMSCIDEQKSPPRVITRSDSNNKNRLQRGGKPDARAVNTTGKGQGNKQSTTRIVTIGNKADGSRPTYGASNQPVITLTEKKNKPYSFRRDKMAKIFRDALKDNLPLPVSKRPEDADKSDQPNFCPYHRVLGHTIEDCYVFKDIIERKYKSGDIVLPQSVLQDPAPHAQVNVVCHGVTAPHALRYSENSEDLLSTQNNLQDHAPHAQVNMVFHATVASTCDLVEKNCPVAEGIFKVDT